MKNETYIANIPQPGKFFTNFLFRVLEHHMPAEKPWKLGRSVNGFTLAEGQEWHRDDFTREMLPEGLRPWIKGEDSPAFLQEDSKHEYSNDGKTWIKIVVQGLGEWHDKTRFLRTSAPLPDPYEELKAAHAAGKVIQCMSLGNWIDIDPVWNCAPDKYRIKPGPAPDDDGWIPHDGVECPVDGVDIEIKCRDERVLFREKARHVRWEKNGSDGDVTHYRLAKPSEKKPDIESEVCEDIKSRQEKGIAKYGQTVADNPLQLREWMQHTYEELLDAAVYLKRAMKEAK